MNERTPRIALDVDVLAKGEGGRAQRVCEILCEGFAQSPQLAVQFVATAEGLPAVEARLRAAGLTQAPQAIEAFPSKRADIALSPSWPTPSVWREDREVVCAHIIYDLMAIARPELFPAATAKSAHDLVSGFDQRTLVLTFSRHAKQDLLRYRPDLSPAQVAVIAPAASKWFAPCESADARAAARIKYGIRAGVPYVLGGAMPSPRATEQLVQAFLRAVRARPENDLHLVLIGSLQGEPGGLAAALAEAGEDRARIVQLKHPEDEDLSALYSDALCFVDLSRHDGTGLAMLEAMACGTPVVCVGDDAAAEVVGDAGVLLDTDDVQAAANAIAQLGASPEQRQALAVKALQRARLFDRDRCVSSVTDALLDVHQRYRAWPSSLLWQRRNGPLAGAAPVLGEPPRPPASYLGYENGAQGPNFGLAVQGREASSPEWPAWRDVLAAPAAAARPEGGLRMRGVLKSGTTAEPLVSYVTVVRNNVATLERAIESVQRQTYRNVEHIVLDGASTDGTVDLILRHADWLDYFVSEPDRGLYDAINKAVPLARGQLICILNSDDWLEPHAAEIAVHRMRGLAQEAAMLTTGAVVYTVEGKPVVEWPPAFVHPGSYFICANDCHNGIYATRSAYERSGPYDAAYKIAADFKWIMTSLDAGVRFVYTQEVTVNYSLGGTSGDALGHSRDCMRVVSERFPFLTSEEVRGLYDSFFGLGHQRPDGLGPRGEAPTRFLRQVFAAHADRPDFQAAVAWAAMTRLVHPDDAPASSLVPVAGNGVPSIRRSAKDLAKGILHRFPFLYNAAARCYAWFRG